MSTYIVDVFTIIRTPHILRTSLLSLQRVHTHSHAVNATSFLCNSSLENPHLVLLQLGGGSLSGSIFGQDRHGYEGLGDGRKDAPE